VNTFVQQASKQERVSILVPAAWGLTLAVSILPDILFREGAGQLPGWLYAAKVVVLAVFLLTSLFWRKLSGLKLYAAILLVLYVVQWAAGQIFSSIHPQNWIATGSPFLKEMLAVQAPRLAVSLLMLLALLALTRSVKRFYFRFGDRDAIAAPIRWILDKPTPWKNLGPLMCVCLLLGMIAITWLMGTHPTPDQLARALPWLPVVLLCAMLNSLGEELPYRAALLAGLVEPVGARQALAVSAVYFGISHFYGVPYGVMGVALSTFMGWLLGRSMLETRGIFWPWMIHVCLDTVIFSFMAIGAVTPGG
jgi:membrane protease YdiL (CAAX protease family)